MHDRGSACVHLTANNIYEVLLAMPFGHSLMLLQHLCDFFDAASSSCSRGKDATSPRNSSLPGGTSITATLETPCQAALIIAYVHHSQLAEAAHAHAPALRKRPHWIQYGRMLSSAANFHAFNV